MPNEKGMPLHVSRRPYWHYQRYLRILLDVALAFSFERKALL
ncbi:MAG: hypothetical protein E6590_04675 [Clostridiales bacterium]|nr:hypothetical protein [Clostridiales bacterium]